MSGVTREQSSTYLTSCAPLSFLVSSDLATRRDNEIEGR